MTIGALLYSGIHKVEELLLHLLCHFAQCLCLFIFFCLGYKVPLEQWLCFLWPLMPRAEHRKQSGKVVSSLTNAYPSGRLEKDSFKFGFPVRIVRPQWPWEITKEENHHLSQNLCNLHRPPPSPNIYLVLTWQHELPMVMVTPGEEWAYAPC